MGRSFIEVHRRGVWASDTDFEVWAYRMYELAAGSPDPGLRRYRDHLLVQATVPFTGCKSLDADELSENTRSELAAIADRLPEHLQTHPRLQSADELNQLGLGGPGSHFTRDIPVAPIASLSRILAEVLRGKGGWDFRDPQAEDWSAEVSRAP